MKKSKLFLLLFSLIAITTFQSCKLTSTAMLYNENSVNPANVKTRTVAIVPNRLPMSLQNYEFWRKNNYDVMSDALRQKGYNVIDYNTALQYFKESGLPLEDTKSSRDKYAEIAQKLNADILVFPYYGTVFDMTTYFVMINVMSYSSIGSFQFYSASQNDFVARVDFEGQTKINKAYLLIPLVGILIDIFGAKSTKAYFMDGFKIGIDNAVNEFAMRYPPNYGGGGAAYPQNNAAPQGGGGKYAQYSLEDLDVLKKAAVNAGDYKTANEIKQEIDRRKK